MKHFLLGGLLAGSVLGTDAATVEFDRTDAEVTEGNFVGFSLVFSEAPPLPLSLRFLAEGIAQPLIDFALNSDSGGVTAGGLQAREQNVFQALDDGLAEPDESVTLTLTNLPPGFVLGTRQTLKVVIHDAAPEVYSQLDVFDSSTFSYTEATPLLASPQASFYRRGDTNIAFTVDYQVEGPMCVSEPADGSRIIQSGTVAFAAGERQKQVILAPFEPLNDNVVNPCRGRKIVLSLLNPSSPVQVGNDGQSTVYFTDDEHSTRLDVAFQPPDPIPLADFRKDGGMSFGNPRVAYLPDGRLLVEGDFDHVNGEPRQGLVRFLPSGEVDRGFIADLNFDPPILPGNFRLLTGTRDGGGLLFTEDATSQSFIRLKADGSRDVNFRFPTNCYASPAWTDQAAWEDVDGGFLLAGRFTVYPDNQDSGLVRLRANGSIDPQFKRPAGEFSSLAVVRQPDRKILLATFQGLSRWLTDGAPDPTFGANDLQHGVDRQLAVGAILLLADGRIVACGPALRGFKADGSSDPSLPQAALDDSQGGSVFQKHLAVVGDHLVVSGSIFLSEAPEDFPLRNVMGVHLVSFWLDPARAAKTSFLVVSGQRDPSGFPNQCCGDFAVFPDPNGEATATIVRFGDVSDQAEVSYFTRDGSARAAVDYRAQAGALTFQPGEHEKTIHIPLISRNQSGLAVSFDVGLSQRDQATSVSPPTTLVIDHGLGFAPGKLRLKALSDGHVVVRFENSQFDVLPSISFELQTSTDLRNWAKVGDLGKDSTFWTWTDQETSPIASRFYRVLAWENAAAP